MKKVVICITVLLTSFFMLSAQTDLVIKKADIRTNKAGFEAAWKHLRQGNTYFALGKGMYKQARDEYYLAHGYNPNAPALNYKLGVSCLFSDSKWEALHYLKLAYELDEDVAPDIHLMLGMAYQHKGLFGDARGMFTLAREETDPRDSREIEKIDKYISECESGMQIIKDTARLEFVNIGQMINSPQDDYSPVIVDRGSRLFYTSRRPYFPRARTSRFDYKPNENIFVSYLKDNKWDVSSGAGKKINTKYNEGILAASPSGDELFLYVGYSGKGDIFQARFKNGKWKKPSKIKMRVNSGQRETGITFSVDGTEVFFTSDRKGKTAFGGYDIYYMKVNEKGKWEKPVNMGDKFNTSWDEIAVSLDKSGDTLYFSSTGHNSIGGYDVFRSVRKDGEWSRPENMGFPINTAEDELFFRPYTVAGEYLLSTIREDTYGGLDIYILRPIPPEPEPEPVPEPKIDTVVLRDTVVIEHVYEPEPEPEPEPEIVKMTLRGRVLSADEESSVMAKIEIIDLSENKVIATTISEPEEGRYTMKLPVSGQYAVEIAANGFLAFLDMFNLPDSLPDMTLNRDFNLTPVKVGAKVVLKNIFFEYNSAVLSPESYAELDRVVTMLETNEGMRIEVSGHTDNIGSQAVNEKISKDRAKAVVDYLVSKGIDTSLLEYRGYGFSQPVASNDTEEGRAQNRRVEFKILSIQ